MPVATSLNCVYIRAPAKMNEVGIVGSGEPEIGIFGNDRFLLQMAIGTMPHAKLMKAIELYGTKVAPLVRRETAGNSTAAKPAA